MDYYSNEDGLIIEVAGPVMKITYNRPELKNGGDWKSMKQSAKAWNIAIENPEIRVIILTGTGEYFNTGGRVDSNNSEERERYAKAISESIKLKKQVRQPIIAVVNGYCLKGGVGIVADADLAVACRDAKFGFPEIRMGGVPMVVMAQTMCIPKKFLLEACYSNEYFDAEHAYRIGLVNTVCDREDLWKVVDRYVHMIIDNPQSLIQMTHDAYYALSSVSDEDDRISLAQKMLSEKVLPQMAIEKTQYNV